MQILSAYTNYEYRIDLYIPDQLNVNTPVYYVLDGLSYFQYAKETIRLQSVNPLKTKIEHAVVVGICHQEKDMKQRRFFDFTGPAENVTYPDRMKNRIPAEVGGAVAFHQFIELECKPAVHAALPYTPTREILFGHSLGGYYSLWTLLHHPESFQAYIAISPSIWWNDYELMEKVQITPLPPSPTVFIAVGEQETFMVKDAKEMYHQLQTSIKKINFYEGLEENHASIVPTSMSRAFRFMRDAGTGSLSRRS